MHWYEGPNVTIKVGRSTATTLKIVTNCHQNMPIIRKKSDESGITPPYFPAIMKCHYPTFHCITYLIWHVAIWREKNRAFQLIFPVKSYCCKDRRPTYLATILHDWINSCSMAIWAVEFSNRRYKIRKIFA